MFNEFSFLYSLFLFADPHAAEKYICVSCKGLFENAATLLKHAQEDHGMQIYTFPKEERPFSRSRSVSVESVSQVDSLSPKSTTSSTSKQLIPKPIESSLPQIIHPPLAPIPVHSPHSHPVDGHTPPFPVLIRPTGPDRLYSPGMERLYPHINHMHRRDFHMPPPESRITEIPPHISPVSIADFHTPQLPFVPPPPPPLPPPHLQPQHQPPTDSSAANHLKLLAKKSPPLSPHRRLPYPGYPTRRYPSFSSKGKSCEFCGKTFKFQSNLVVHRRSHTGEKPFKCHLCDHACSQASKLKRHMKTHMNKPPSAMGSAPDMDDKDENSNEEEGQEGSMGTGDRKNMSDSSSPEEEEMEEEEEEEDEEEEEKEEEEEEEEEPDEADMVDIKPKEPEREDEEITVKSEGEAKSSEQEFEEERSKERRPSSADVERVRNVSRGSPKGLSHHHSSLLSEMMVNSGLDEIQQYSEAFKQAIAERNIIFGKPRSSSDVSSPENHHPRNSNSRPPSRPQDHHSPIESSLMARLRAEHTLLQGNHPLTPGIAERSAMSDLELVTNRIKMEPSTSWPPSPLAIHREPLMSSPVRSDASPLGTTNGGPAAFFAQRRFIESNGGMPSNAVLPYSSPPNRMKPQRATEKRSDTCEFCGKRFKNCSNLTVHRRSHTGEKPYKCQLCSYACAQSSKLTRHMKTHGHGAKEVFKCEVCNMPFSVYSTLEKHMKKEHWGAIKGLAPRSDAVGARMYSYKANLPGLSK
ncbi:B-cell lymphoma/leukemia 11B-like [Lytechinus variegatus]|uniref:B-cell lymphoma/leukemia 11B-like n=1 Tax=Lytechinus variegatus TaxID=7654 RepID=UPI001BB1B6FC|nr:B-cell lymphoma/leukemia 11B-like [Lytechinus variegatus]